MFGVLTIRCPYVSSSGRRSSEKRNSTFSGFFGSSPRVGDPMTAAAMAARPIYVMYCLYSEHIICLLVPLCAFGLRRDGSARVRETVGGNEGEKEAIRNAAISARRGLREPLRLALRTSLRR